MTEFAQRRSRFLPALDSLKLDAFLVTALPNVRYLSGFTGSNAALLLTRRQCFLFTDPRYQFQAPQESDCRVKVAKGNVLAAVASSVKAPRIRTLGFEHTRISYEDYSVLHSQMKGIRLKGVGPVIESLRAVKSPAEIATIRAAVELNSLALQQALRRCKVGMTESDLAAEIEYRMRRLGADGPSFETIVASGPRTALPHAHPTSAPIAANQLLLIDMGASVAGYASDMTRTMGIGRIDAESRRMYSAVLESQLAAIDAIRPGVNTETIDKVARNVLKRHGYEKLFLHSTGHGLGLEIHESPRIGRTHGSVLEEGMAITIEPGVYREGFGGIRIEDTVVVTARGVEVLTPTAKEWMVL